MPRGNPNLRLNNTPWPEDRTQRLRRMFSAGCTDEEIALAVGVTVRAVVGKRNRLKLKRWNKEQGPLEAALRRAAKEKRES